MTKESNIEHPFHQLTDASRRTLCAAAQASVLENGVVLRNIEEEVEVNKFTVHYLNGTDEDHVGLKCSKIPSVVIFLAGTSKTTIRVLVEENPFLDKRYEFKLDTVKSVKYKHGEFSKI